MASSTVRASTHSPESTYTQVRLASMDTVYPFVVELCTGCGNFSTGVPEGDEEGLATVLAEDEGEAAEETFDVGVKPTGVNGDVVDGRGAAGRCAGAQNHQLAGLHAGSVLGEAFGHALRVGDDGVGEAVHLRGRGQQDDVLLRPVLGRGGHKLHQRGLVLSVLHDHVIPFRRRALHRSAVGIHQPLRVDPQEAGFLAGVQDHLDLDGVSDDRLPVTCMGDPPGVDLDHLGLVGSVELPAEEELLTDSDIPVFHDLSYTLSSSNFAPWWVRYVPDSYSS